MHVAREALDRQHEEGEEAQEAAWHHSQGEPEVLFDGFLAEVVYLIQRLKPRDYIDSEWCENGHGFIAACDA
jgi:hypothetical protein